MLPILFHVRVQPGKAAEEKEKQSSVAVQVVVREAVEKQVPQPRLCLRSVALGPKVTCMHA